MRHSIHTPGVLLVLRLSMLLLVSFRAPAASPELTIRQDGTEIVIRWTAVSLTQTEPYEHNDFQLQQSLDLTVWSNVAPRVLGGTISDLNEELSKRVPLGNGTMFFRLARFFDRAGADLSGLDFSDADLSGANLAGANLAGAQLAGASFRGANIEGVDLSTVPLAGVDLSGTIGTPVFEQVQGPADGLVSELLPRLPRYPGPEEFVTNNSVFPGKGLAKQLAVVGLKPDATVGQLNVLLAAHEASIVSSTPMMAGVGLASLLVRFSTENPDELNDLTKGLEHQAGVALALPDIQLQLDVVTDDVNAANGAAGWSWDWDEPPTETGGNWGLEYARVPQMWNYGESIMKARRDSVPTLIVDGGFPSHPDLSIHVLNPATGIFAGDHGLHVAGIVAASYGNTQGIDGVNPFAKLRGFTFEKTSAWPMRDSLITSLVLAPDTKIVNISIGFGWTEDGTITLSTKELVEAWRYATNYGQLCYDTITNNPGRLFVCSAGNDYGGVPATINSAWTAAALVHGAPNVLVVGSLDPGGAMSPFSNLGAHVQAPGGQILSLAPGGAYAIEDGTSMATPFVSGVAGFLWAADPNLSVAEVTGLIRHNGFGLNVDAFTSLIGIDGLRAADQPILRGILDIDDGSELDGATRVLVPALSHLGDRNFYRISGDDFTDLDVDQDGGLGDGKIDMGDFRMWRDWLLYGEEEANFEESLNGSDANPKFDANQDGKREAHRELKLYPRGDFNGDGIMDRQASRDFKGLPLTDLEVLMTSGLWQDPDVDAGDIAGLIDSVDLIVSAESLFEKEPSFPEAVVHLYDADTGAKLDSMFKQPLTLTRDKPVRILTVPIDKNYFLASDPVQQLSGEEILMRSIGNMTFGRIDRGGDFAVDLTGAEMTARFETQDPFDIRVDSDPLGRAVVAVLEKAIAADPLGDPPQAYSDDQANLFTRAKSFPDPTAPKQKQTLYTAEVKWLRSFTKLPNVPEPKYHVKPIRLQLSDHDHHDTNELSAEAMIILERRVGPATNAEWQTMFFSSTKIVGRGDPGSANTFRIEEHNGIFPDPQPEFIDDDQLGRVGMIVEFPDFFGRIPLTDIPDSGSFELRYTLKAEVLGPLNEFNPCDGECFADAFVGDPLNYSGISMRYGDFGGLFELQGFSLGQGGEVIIPYSSGPDFYFVLFETNELAQTETPVAIQMGLVGTGTFIVNNPLPGTTIEDYRLMAVRLAWPVDVDGDGIDDLYEYNRPTILDPLNPSDAGIDHDDDGFTTLAEYQNGTDPLVKDAPAQDQGLYAGLAQASTAGLLLRVKDVNRDNVPDQLSLAGSGLIVALGNPNGTWQAPVETHISWPIIYARDMAVAQLDADDIPDVVISASVENKAYLYKGLGNGRFEFTTELTTGNNPRGIVALRLDGDTLLDLAILNERSKSISLFLNQGSGSFSPLTEVLLDEFGSSLDVATGDVNGDGIADLVASANGESVAVMFGAGNGSFLPKESYTVNRFPDHIALGDLDGDGHLDIATSSASTDTLFVLYNNGSGSFGSGQTREVPENPLGMVIRDLNGDGRGSLVMSHRASLTTVLDGRADRSLESISFLSVQSEDLPVLSDLDGDGLLDLLNTTSGSSPVYNLSTGAGRTECLMPGWRALLRMTGAMRSRKSCLSERRRAGWSSTT